MDSVGNESSFEAVGLDHYASDADLGAVELFKNYNEPLLNCALASTILFMLIGIPGNLITIIALAKCKKVRNATAIFIMNLSCSDLLFCCFNLPLAASTFWSKSWQHGKILCHMFPFARYSLVAVSVFTVLAITVNRYVLISFPHSYPKLYRKKYIWLMIICIWLGSFGSLLPTCFAKWGKFSLDPITGSCSIIPDSNGVSPKKFIFIIAFLLPSIAIIVCYARILWIVRKQAKQSRGLKPFNIKKTMQTSISMEKSLDFDLKRPSRQASCQPIFKCFMVQNAELSSSCDTNQGDQESKTIAPEVKTRTLNNSETAKTFRQSFIATMRWTTAPRKPRLPTKKDKKLLTMIMAIMITFFVCHLPITLAKTIYPQFSSHPVANIVGYVLIYLTPCVNPIIYVVMSSEYRQAYKKLWTSR